MLWAVRKDGLGWRTIEQETDLLDFEVMAVDEPSPIMEPVSNKERTWRDFEIERVQWIRERHRDESDLGISTTITPAQFSGLLTYIQKLRDWPESKDFPVESKRPQAPPWIAEQAQ